jgi:hypothetical protein
MDASFDTAPVAYQDNTSSQARLLRMKIGSPWDLLGICGEPWAETAANFLKGHWLSKDRQPYQGGMACRHNGDDT